MERTAAFGKMSVSLSVFRQTSRASRGCDSLYTGREIVRAGYGMVGTWWPPKWAPQKVAFSPKSGPFLGPEKWAQFCGTKCEAQPLCFTLCAAKLCPLFGPKKRTASAEAREQGPRSGLQNWTAQADPFSGPKSGPIPGSRSGSRMSTSCRDNLQFRLRGCAL